MIDRFGREINYLRISVTDKCNLRCVYCMPEEGVPKREHADFLRFEEIAAIAREAAGLGIRKVRLTGGEPLVKRNIVTLVEMLNAIGGISHLAMSTNGTRLAACASDLRRAGLDSVNVSLDTLDPQKYREITRCGRIEDVLEGIEAARRVGFPMKINTVVLEETTDAEILRMKRFCEEGGVKLQLINHFSLSRSKQDRYTFDRPPDCSQCNRIRLMADGVLKPCLHSDIEIPVNPDAIRQSLLEAVRLKPEHGTVCLSRGMVEIGG